MWWPFSSGKKHDADSYKKELTEIAARISKRQEKQLRYSTKLRRFKGVITLYGLLVYAIYSVVCFTRERYHSPRHVTGLVGVPVVIYIVRLLAQSLFNWWSASNDEILKALQNDQQQKIEELKEKTNFYSTKELLDRFDSDKSKDAKQQDKKPPGKPQHQRQGSQLQPPEGMSKEFTFNAPVPQPPGSPPANVPLQPGPGQGPAPAPVPGLAPGPGQSPPPPPPPGVNQLQPVHAVPYQPKWYDRVLDMIAGEDEYSPKGRYALICAQCQNHNGLAPPGETPEHTMYICPHCGAKNGKPRNKRKDDELESEPPQEPEAAALDGVTENDSSKPSSSTSVRSRKRAKGEEKTDPPSGPENES